MTPNTLLCGLPSAARGAGDPLPWDEQAHGDDWPFALLQGLTSGSSLPGLCVAHLGGLLQRAQGQVPLAGAPKKKVKPGTEPSSSVSYP